jgi:transposase
MTLATSSSWFLKGKRLHVPYQAPQGRRVNAIGAHFTHGEEAGRLAHQSWAVLPKSRAKQPRVSMEARAAAEGLGGDEVGPIDAERVVAFVWRVAGRPEDAPAGWRRERELYVAWDNYAVHKSATVRAAQEQWAAAGVHVVFLAAYCPEQSGIEPVWNDVKQHQMPIRSFERVADLKQAVDHALTCKAVQLRRKAEQSLNLHRLPT